MKPQRSNAEKLSLLMKEELNNPKLNKVKQTYLIEKIKMVGEFLIKKGKI